MPKSFSRRDILKTIGISASAALLPSFSFADENGNEIILPDNNRLKHLDKPLTAITLGAGNRGNVYGNYALKFPDKLDIVGVAEPIAIRNERYATKHKIEDKNRFKTWEDVFKVPKFADAIIITTPDNLHYGPCMAALKMGYHILLEKPISPSEQECRNILSMAKQSGKVVGVCHVLRYAPYFIKPKELMHNGAIGEVVSIQHMEPIMNVHMSHSYVRGNWHNSKETTPIILAKSCHDLDILRWMVEKKCEHIQAFGDLKWFKQTNAPQGSTDRCTNGCAIEATCPYSALKIYYRNRTWLHHFDLPEDKEKQGEAIMNFLKNTNYGKCVYRMDNDQPDHYVTNIQFADSVTASFSMEAFTPVEGRRTRVMGSMGYIEGDMTSFTMTDFRTGKAETWKETTDTHGGGDWHLVENWIEAVSKNDASLLTSTIDQSIESHIMGFMAEKSRLENKVQPVIV